MKQMFLTVPLVSISLLLVIGCRNKHRLFQTYFWTSTKPGTINYLFINDTNRGVLPYLSPGPRCNDDGSKKSALYFPLQTGTYKIAVIDKQGVIKHEEKYSVKNSDNRVSVSSSSNKGSIHSIMEGDCLLAEVRY